MNQPLAGRNPMESTGPVPVVTPEVLEDRVVFAVTARMVATGTPVTPAAPNRLLGVPRGSGIERRERGQEPLESVLQVSANQIEHDPALTVAQVAKALIVKVVRIAVISNQGQALAHTRHLTR